MRTPRFHPGLITIAFAILSSALAENEITRTPDALILGPVDRPKAVYHLVPPPNSGLPVEAGGYFHPFTTPLGAVVTDFVPPDHKHHRGVFLAWVEMHGAVDADFWGWGEHAPIKDRRIVNREVVLGDAGSFTATNEWLAGDTLILTEKLTAKADFSADANVLDLTYRLTPEADTTLARWAFSGFCVRFPKLGDVTVHRPNGIMTLPNPSHDKPDTNWPAAPWYAATWKTPEGATAGVAVVNDARNPVTTWHNHRDLRMLNPSITAPGAVRQRPAPRRQESAL